MAQTKSKIILVVVLALSILLSVLPINALATNTDIVTVKENDNLYYVYVEGLLNQDFEFAFSNSEDATSLNYIVSDKDNSKNSIAYVDEELKANFFNSEDTYIWVKTQDKVIIDGEKIVLDNAKTVEELKTIENITNVITVQANAENEKIKINGEEGVEYYYKVYIAGSSEDYNKFIALVNEVSNYNEKTDFFTKLQGYNELQSLYSSLVSGLGDENWTEAKNNEITKPYNAKEGEQYILWLKDSNGNMDVQILTAYEKEVTIVDEQEKSKEVTTSLPVTYDDTTNLFIVLGIVVIAIIAISTYKIIQKRSKK